ncbi:GMP synthase [Salinivibrio sp. IB574]|uniref:glutamine amidotransferase-related protein n=1 Tax=Salinivibrio sp. IB574 TaxID=1909444 RepID=UPI000988D208|nr:gamma-glutamyl-gamma-aminobutyrate hydrolase family protein [Salinivibrio sp. IB574]OOF22880.1 GMP synthase [Salinivibrio sp. IB574]
MRVHLVIHEAFEGPGAILDWCDERAYHVTTSHLYRGEPLPESGEGIDLLVVLGGPQSPDTPQSECPHFDSQREQALIRQCIEQGSAVLGICLGAQLIGEALGAPYQKSPEPEIGYFPIQLSEDGHIDEHIPHFAPQEIVGHWHNDMPGLTPNSRVLASSEGCPRQIVKYGPRVYGFQCHLELTPLAVEGLLQAAYPEGEAANKRFIQDPDSIRAFDTAPMNAHLFAFLDSVLTDNDLVTEWLF